jgi:hypothetical protein
MYPSRSTTGAGRGWVTVGHHTPDPAYLQIEHKHGGASFVLPGHGPEALDITLRIAVEELAPRYLVCSRSAVMRPVVWLGQLISRVGVSLAAHASPYPVGQGSASPTA